MTGLIAGWLAASPSWAMPQTAASDGSSPTEALAKESRPTETGSPQVDSEKVHRLYIDGEFDPAIAILEANLRETREYRHEDSVFILKHLGVMYAARYETQEKGRYYMQRLLDMEPTARIMDMYASDMVYMIFRNIRREYEQNRMPNGSPRESGEGRPYPAAVPEEGAAEPPRAAGRESGIGNGRKWIWAGIAAATVAAGIGAYVLMNGLETEPRGPEHGVSF